MKHTLRLLPAILLFQLLPLVSISQGLTITFTDSAFCNWNSVGYMDAVVTGGTPPYTYVWSNGSTTQIQTNLYPGTYCLTVTDSQGNDTTLCHATQTELQATISTTPETCSTGDGKAWVNIIHGTPPYHYGWNGIPGTDTSFNLHYGDYTLNMVDAAGCMFIGDTMQFTIAHNLPFSYTISHTPYHCPTPGTAAVHLTGGTPPLAYLWNTTPLQNSDSVSNLFAGTYTVTISDATPGCSVTEYVNIINDLPLNLSLTSTPAICNFVNGTATVIPTSGTPPYTYIWNTTPLQATPTATHLTSGTYSVTVTDATGCMAYNSLFVLYNSPIQLNLVAANETCSNANGSIASTPQLGTSPYTFQWSVSGNSPSIQNLTHGYYSLTVSDAVGCTVAASRYINNVPSYAVNITYTPTSCTSFTGTATATVTGNTGPYTYKWSTTPVQTAQTATGLPVGYYQCTVTDANQCSGVYYVNIPYISNIQGNLVAGDALCLTASGNINTNVYGGQAPYTFHWSNNQTAQNPVNLLPGSYYVTVVDALGCSNVKSAYVGSYSNLQMSLAVTNASCIFTNDGQATITVNNYTAPLTYQWSNGQNTPTATGLNPGWWYNVYVSDANGCTAQSSTSQIGYTGLGCAAQVSGKVINDLDQNCLWTPGDIGLPNIVVSAIPGYYDITNANGDYSFILPPGNYAINQTLPYHTFQLCPVGPISLFGLTAGSDTVGNNFYDTVRIAYDLSVSYDYVNVPRPGFNHRVIINYGNEGNVTMNAVIEYDYDSILTLASASLPYTIDLINHKIYFNINNIQTGSHSYFYIDFTTPSATVLGTLISECVHITPIVNDVNFVNNDDCHSIQVVGSFDPNTKTNLPKGTGAEGYISRNDSILYYTIRFQNTGSHYATNVVVVDTLDANLDPATVKLITASHEVQPAFIQNKYLAFYFNNINLPDSTSDQEGSHGLVSFQIKQKPNLADGTPIPNRAAIYFDYNLPVITNSVLNTINITNGIPAISNWPVNVYPNPTTGLLNIVFDNATDGKVTFEMYDLIGEKVLSKIAAAMSGRNQLQLSAQNIKTGLYTLYIKNEQGQFSVKKIVVQK